jgi:hypothetical protein
VSKRGFAGAIGTHHCVDFALLESKVEVFDDRLRTYLDSKVFESQHAQLYSPWIELSTGGVFTKQKISGILKVFQ